MFFAPRRSVYHWISDRRMHFSVPGPCGIDRSAHSGVIQKKIKSIGLVEDFLSSSEVRDCFENLRFLRFSEHENINFCCFRSNSFGFFRNRKKWNNKMSLEVFISETVKSILVAIPCQNELTHEPFFQKISGPRYVWYFFKKRTEGQTFCQTLSRNKRCASEKSEKSEIRKSGIPKSEIRKSRKMSKLKCSYLEELFIKNWKLFVNPSEYVRTTQRNTQPDTNDFR